MQVGNNKEIKKRRQLYIVDFGLTPTKRIDKCGILVEKGKILAIGGASAFSRDLDIDIFEFKDCYATPGFIDSHIHGGGGFDSSSADDGLFDITSMCALLASHGVTSFIPTVVSMSADKMLANLSYLADLLEVSYNGAQPVGIHIEGPFINRQKHGSQAIDDIRDVDLGFARELIAAGKGHVRLSTFAPELENSDKLIELFLDNNIRPSMGHSLANEADVLRAIDAGATRCTHIYNGMPPLHQRNINLTSVALTDDRVTTEIILDGILLDPRMIDLVCRAKPKDKIIGISDAIAAVGLRDGYYHLGKSKIEVKNGRSTTADGALAGTTLTLENGWHYLVTYSHLKDTEAARCVTMNPANDLGLQHLGELLPGKRADISFFYKENNKTRLTISGGRIVYDSENKLTGHDFDIN